MSKHTSGKWNVTAPRGTLAAWRIMSNDESNVAFIAHRLSNDETNSNAQLIALAPELLDILKNLMEFWDECSPVHPGAEIVGEVRKLISRAEGEI